MAIMLSIAVIAGSDTTMPQSNDDPTPEIYLILDRAGLDGANILASRRPMAKIVNEIRTSVVKEMRSYIVRRDHQMFNKGFHAKEARKSEGKND